MPQYNRINCFIGLFLLFQGLVDLFFGFSQPFLAQPDQLGGPFDLSAQFVDVHLLIVKPLEDLLHFGDRLRICNFRFFHLFDFFDFCFYRPAFHHDLYRIARLQADRIGHDIPAAAHDGKPHVENPVRIARSRQVAQQR